ncbi:MAG: putative motility protein [Lachnospiraceae bacterium]|jgi:hypothetical protein|nr:putative motility protein [Lachnospiraceae bacterium]
MVQKRGIAMEVGMIEGMSVNMSQNSLMTKVGTEVLAMSLDQLETTGAGLVDMMNRSMMENSVTPNLGGNIDVMV